MITDSIEKSLKLIKTIDGVYTKGLKGNYYSLIIQNLKKERNIDPIMNINLIMENYKRALISYKDKQDIYELDEEN